MWGIWDKNKTAVLYILLSVLSVFLILFSRADFPMNLRKVYAVTAYPIQYGTRNFFRSVRNLYASISELSRLKKELSKTKEKLLRYESAAADYEEILRENTRLKRMLGNKENIEYNTYAASIVAKDPQSFYKTIIIDRGYNNGIKKSMPVIAYQGGQKGLVGKIIEVSANYSKIIPIIDAKCKVGVTVESSRDSGIMEGQSPKSLDCRIRYIVRSADIRRGDKIITSGMGGVFPKGINVGTVTNVDNKKYGLYQDVYVNTTIDFSTLEDVYVIDSETDEEILEMLERNDL